MDQIDAYLEKTATESQRALLQHIREYATSLIPEAEETISYGIPTLKYKGKYVIYFAAFKNHMSVFPGSAITAELEAKLGGKFTMHKGTVQFTEANPLPDAIIKQIVTDRLKVIKEKPSGKVYA